MSVPELDERTNTLLYTTTMATEEKRNANSSGDASAGEGGDDFHACLSIMLDNKDLRTLISNQAGKSQLL